MRACCLKVIATFVALTIAGGCNGPTEPTPPPAPAVTYTLSGVVTAMSQDGVIGVEGVYVELENRSGTQTDAKGVYSFSGVPAGAYQLRFSKYAFEPVTIVASVTSDRRMDVRMERIPTFVVTGFVYELTASGRQPVEDAFIAIEVWHGYGRTDATGAFRIEPLTPGTGEVFVEKKGYRTLVKPITIASDQHLEFELQRDAAVGTIWLRTPSP